MHLRSGIDQGLRNLALQLSEVLAQDDLFLNSMKQNPNLSTFDNHLYSPRSSGPMASSYVTVGGDCKILDPHKILLNETWVK